MATFEETSEYIRNKFWDFLETYQEVIDDEEATLFYIQQLQSMREEDKTTMYVDYEHLSSFDPELAELVQVSLTEIAFLCHLFLHFASHSSARRNDKITIEYSNSHRGTFGVATLQRLSFNLLHNS